MPKVMLKSGVSIYYEEFGVGDPMVFIAGFTADHSAWNAVAKICATSHRVIIFDNRGVGQSDCPCFPYTAELLADDTQELCETLGIKQAYFVGNSMGGQVVMALAYRYPKLVSAAIISNAVLKIGPFFTGYTLLLEAHLSLIRFTNSQKELSSKLSEIFAKTNLGWLFSGAFLDGAGITEQLVKFQLENKYPITEAGFISQRNVFMTFDASKWLDKIKCPCLVIASDGDMILPMLEVQKVAYAIPNAQYFLFTKVGHLPHAERPEDFSEILFKFAASLSDHQKYASSADSSRLLKSSKIDDSEVKPARAPWTCP